MQQDRDDVIRECISILQDKRQIYRTPEFSYPNGCLISVIVTSMLIKELEQLLENEVSVAS